MGFIDSMINLGRNAGKISNNDILIAIWNDAFVQDFIINLNTNEQLFYGDLANGGKMPEGNPNYIKAKGSRGSPDGISTNLLLDGDFYDSFDIQITSTGFVIIANTSIHGKDFVDLYGFDILGLNDENLQKLINFIREDYKEELTKRIIC